MRRLCNVGELSKQPQSFHCFVIFLLWYAWKNASWASRIQSNPKIFCLLWEAEQRLNVNVASLSFKYVKMWLRIHSKIITNNGITIRLWRNFFRYDRTISVVEYLLKNNLMADQRILKYAYFFLCSLRHAYDNTTGKLRQKDRWLVSRGR